MSALLFVVSGLFLLALPLVVLLIWSIGRESRLREEQRVRTLTGATPTWREPHA